MAELTRNRMLDTLGEGRVAIGMGVSFVRTPAIIRMIARAGFDFVNIDMEHSSLSWETVHDMAEMARSNDVTPIVRPYNYNGLTADRILDLGAMGLMMFDVRTRAQVDDIRQYLQYPPRGIRGTTTQGSPTDYETDDPDGMREHIDATTALVIQIESREAVEDIDSILAGGGVDVVEVGRNDISGSYGVPHQTGHPEVLKAIDRVVEAAHRHGCYPGTTTTSEEDARDLVRRGVRHLSFSSDRAMLNRGMRAGTSMLRAVADELV
ncbi:MAG: aldolase/citrate lyase family protein [Nocardioides sp.]